MAEGDEKKGFWEAAGTRAVAGILLLLLGVLLTFQASGRYVEKRYVVDAGACRMDMMSTERADMVDKEHYTAVVFHGIAANKLIMEYWARTLAEMGLRVFTPDLPGHGRSPGPFTPAHAEECALSFVRGLAARGLLYPDRTILAGHSMGGAIALRVAEKFRPAGVIAVSPAPMEPANGATTEALLFLGRPKIGPNTLILAGQFEPRWIVMNASDLAAGTNDPTVKFEKVEWNSHVSVLFSRVVARRMQAWVARIFGLPDERLFAPRSNFVGGVLGLIGILLLAGPFLREMCGKKTVEEPRPADLPSAARMIAECVVVAFAAMFVLKYFMPLRPIHIFEGDYLASFFLLTGVALLALHPKLAKEQWRGGWGVLLGTAIAGFVLHFLITGWFELTMTESWLTLARWARFPVFFLAAWVFLYALEVVLGPAALSRYRILLALVLVAICWSAMGVGVFFLHTGEILPTLLSPYFAMCFVAIYLGAQLVRRVTASATAAAVFGAILLSGFCLALFPLS